MYRHNAYVVKKVQQIMQLNMHKDPEYLIVKKEISIDLRSVDLVKSLNTDYSKNIYSS